LGERTHEEVVGIGYRAADSEEFHQVMELAVDVAAYLDIVSVERKAEDDGGRGWKHTVTGAFTVTTLPSSINSSLAL
jgi:hypothetical protein